ncbi:MAG: stage III sporulation protein AD [Clostridiales bacterium]|jgi:stage III sporulation protein AD|nr:stage III sporulation protein AD [Clostridiales bacterium]
MEVAAVVGLTVAAAFLAVILRQQRPEYALAIGLMAGVAILTLIITKAVPVFNSLKELLDKASLPVEYGAVLFKALGVCLLTQLASDACEDAGEKALAAKAELAGKVALLILALPLFQKVAEMAASLMNGQAVGG